MTFSDSDMELIGKYFNVYGNFTVVMEGLTTEDFAECKTCAAVVKLNSTLLHAKWHKGLFKWIDHVSVRLP